MFGESVFALLPDHEVRAAELTNRWISGCWWRRDASSDEHLVGMKHCLSADQFAENLLDSNGADDTRLKLEGRSGSLKWKWILEYPDQLWNHLETRECRQRRHRWTFPQYLHLHLPPEENVPEIRVHSNNGGGDVAAKMETVIYDPSYADPVTTKVMGKVVRYSTFSKCLFQTC